MSELQYLIWFVATAIMTATVLAVGTLASAGLLARGQRHRAARPKPQAALDPEAPEAQAELPTPHDRRHAA